MVLHGNRLEDLRDLMVRRLKADPLPPLCPEVVLVQSNGMKHWLELALADETALGICAATKLELPGNFLWQVYRKVLGAGAVPARMPFDKSTLAWRLMRLLPEVSQQGAVYAPLRRYLADDADGRRKYQLALQIADVFDGYQSYRADWLADWSAGRDVLNAEAKNAVIGEAHAWQPHLWRALQADVVATQGKSRVASRAEVHRRFMSAIHDMAVQADASENAEQLAGLPPRIIVFGISSLPMQIVEALAALGQVRQVLMFVQNPCRHYWGDLFGNPGDCRKAGHPLLASWGQQGRDYLHLLDECGTQEKYRQPAQKVEVFVDPVAGGNASLLTQVQSAILNLEPLPDVPRALDATDASVKFVMTHSAQREVEVLHDQLLAWFDADVTLEPRDVMVMVPDIENFAPHVQAVFGRFPAGESRHIPFSVADTTHRQTPLVHAAEFLLSLPSSRVSINDWLGLFEISAVRKRFMLGEADVEQLQVWLESAGVRWGIDAQHRAECGMPSNVHGADQNTWAFGLRRMLLGYAVGEAGPWQNTLPLGEVGGLDAELIGKLVNWLDAIEQTVHELVMPMVPAQWLATITKILARFFDAGDEAEERLLQRLLDPVDAWRQACDDASMNEIVPLVVVREHWLAQIQLPTLHQRFFGGGVQFGTLMPMRSIPFKVVCLLGMNDADYPRRVTPRDFDLMSLNWRPGDRSRREDDRYLFLEAMLSARERFYISWQGRRVSDNAEQPPSVLVAQLMDYLNAGWNLAPAPVLQPLQAFSRRYFETDSDFHTYADDWRRVHAGGIGDAGAGTIATVDASIAPLELTLDQLRQLVRQPVEVFFRGRMQVKLESPTEAAQEDEPFTLDGLDEFQVGQEFLDTDDAQAALRALQLCGRLPMAAFGARAAQQLDARLLGVRMRMQRWQAEYPESLPTQSVDLDVCGARLRGTLAGLRSSSTANTNWLQLAARPGAVLEGKEGSKTARGHVVASLWVSHVAACAVAPDGVEVTSVQLGADAQVKLPHLERTQAMEILGTLVATWREAWVRPLPVAIKSAWAFVQTPDEDANEKAREAFEGSFMRDGEHARSAYLQRAFEHFDDIENELPRWAEALYGVLARTVKVEA
jgi:exodeoxyribonuclease V gamma subunit